MLIHIDWQWLASRCPIIVILILAALSNSSRVIVGQRNEASEMPEDCDQNLQYFHTTEAKCRNCSDVMRLFEPGYQDWQQGASGNSETITLASPTAATNGNNNKQTARQQHRNSIISSVIGSRLTPLPPNGGPVSRVRSGNQQAPDAILSRLVLPTSQRDPPNDQGSPALSNSEDDTDGDESANLPQVAPKRHRNQPETGGARRVAGDEQARMWHQFLTSFVRSRELAQTGLLEAIGQCRLEANSSACQMWSNVCALTMYSHSDAPMSQPSSSSTSDSALARTTSYVGRNNAPLRPAMSWQECPEFSLASTCNSLRDWHRNEKGPGLSEVADIYYNGGAADAELLMSPEGGGATRGPGGVPLVPFKLDQLIQLLAYEYALDGRLVRVSQFDMRDLSKFCLFSPSASLPTQAQGGELRDLGDPSSTDQGSDVGDREKLANENNNNNPGGQDQMHEIRVGRSAGLVCRFNALQAAAIAPKHLNQTKFVDLFIGYQLNGATFIRPVPILLKNLLLLGPSVSLPNIRYAQDPTRWKLVHRYFPLASVGLNSHHASASGSETNINNKTSRGYINYDNNEDTQSSSSSNKEQRALVYARDAKLEIKFKRGQGSSLVISSMLLHLDYDFIRLGQSSGNSARTSRDKNRVDSNVINIQVTQTQVDMPDYLKDLDLMLAIICLVSCIWCLIRCYNIQKYQGLIKLDIYSLALFLIIACDIIANLIALITGLFVLYLFASSKLSPAVLGPLQQQHLLPVMLPPDEVTQQNLLAKLKLAFALKLAGLLYKLRLRLNVDLFFIDWERPKMLTSNQLLMSHHYLHNQASKQQQQQVLNPTGSKQQQFQQISFWRPYSIINRWLQMQTWRRQNLTLQLIALLCCLQFIRLDQLATSYTSSRLTGSAVETPGDYAANPPGPQLVPNQCSLFRCLLLALIYLTLASAQIVYKRLVHEPMLRCAVREFLDLCSVANVSLFAMLYPRYGFYLHGRNANGSSDCGLAEMNVMLEREERDLCSKRGLLPNSDHQAFTMVLPRIINDHYRKLLFCSEHFLHTHTNSLPNSLGLMSTPLMSMAARRPLGTATQHADDSSKLMSPHQFGSSPALTGTSSRSIESVVARNKAINVFLVNFLDHIYKDIDYSVRERRRFESLLELELDLTPGDPDEDDQTAAPRKVQSASGGMLSMMMSGGGGASVQRPGAATLLVDREHSFASLLWLGLEWDLLLIELLTLLLLDLMLGKENLTLTIGLVWLGNKLFQWLYGSMARKNLVTKSMLDEKFLVRP